MLCKTKEYRNIGNNYSVMNTSGSTSASASGKQTNLYNNQNQEYFKWPGKMSFSISHTFSKVGSYNSYGYAGIFVYVDDVMVKSISGGDSTTPNNGTTTFSYTVPTGGTHSIRVLLSGDYASSSSYVTISVSSATATFQGGIDGHKWDGKPSEVKSLWDLGTITIFWIINNDFFVGFTSNTATTGSITPGNFVGYIKIGNYKIPYYND